MPILPTIRPISPLSDAVTAEARNGVTYNDSYANGRHRNVQIDDKKKIGRQLSVASSTNNYAEIHRQQAERALNGNGGLASPPNGHKESFFSHLRKRARRFSGRHQAPMSPNSDDVEAQAGCGPWNSNRSSMVIENAPTPPPKPTEIYEPLDKALRDVQQTQDHAPVPPAHLINPSSALKRHHSLPQHQPRSVDNLMVAARGTGPVSGRTRRQGVQHYDAPDEEDELLDEALNSTHHAMNRMEKDGKPGLRQSASNVAMVNPYPTPSPSANGNSVLFGDNHEAVTPKPLNLQKSHGTENQYKWPTPPYEESEWAASASASIWAASNRF
ncbi:serine/threonine-protein kinase MAK [Colletotrichum higginsianum]|nr:serine/threonine-protein kinase MAK [Colletotrichum higginsianum]